MKKAYHVSLCGIDGSGKSTYGNKLVQELKRKIDVPIVFVDGIKPCIYSNKLRNIASEMNVDYFSYFGEMALISFALDLVCTYENILKCYLSGNYLLITHRYKLCCKTYSMLRDRDNKASKIINKLLETIPNPDLYIYFKVSPKTAMKRILNRNLSEKKQLSINENIECLSELVKLYDKSIQDESISNVISIDTENKSIEETVEYLSQIIETYVKE